MADGLCTARGLGLWPLSLALILATAGTLAAASWDGNYEGRAYTSGSAGCPTNLEVSITVSGVRLQGTMIDTGQYKVGIQTDLDAKGGFSGTFQSYTGGNVRIDGKLEGARFEGYIHHSACRGSWYADRLPP